MDDRTYKVLKELRDEFTKQARVAYEDARSYAYEAIVGASMENGKAVAHCLGSESRREVLMELVETLNNKLEELLKEGNIP